MRRTLVVTTAWITATVLAVSLAFAGVNVVADRVLDPEPSPVVGSAALDDGPDASASPDDEPTGGPSDDATPGDDATDEPSDEPTERRDDGPTARPSATPTTAPGTPDDDRTPDASEPDDDPTPSDSPTAGATLSPTPISSPTSTAASETRTYRMVGGTVTVRFAPDRVSVVSATPNDGFSVHEIEQPAPTVIDLEFRAHDDTHRSKLDAWWQDGPRERIREEPRD